MYHIETDDFYRDLANNPNLLIRMDTSNLPRDHPCYVSTRKKIPGLFSDETDGRTMYEFVALRAKSYAYDVERVVNIRAKGIRRHVIKNHITFNDHKQCLFAEDSDSDDIEGRVDNDMMKKKKNALLCAAEVIKNIHRIAAIDPVIDITTPYPHQHPVYTPYTPYRENVSIRSFNHQVKTVKTLKMTLNRLDDKRVIHDDRVHTYAHGHYKTL